MATRSFADRVSTTRRTLEWVQEHKADLARKGINVDYWLAGMRTFLDSAIAADQAQEDQKASLRNATIAAEKADRAMYVFASGTIDAMAAAHGKDTAEAETLRRFRSKLHIDEAEPAAEPSSPAQTGP